MSRQEAEEQLERLSASQNEAGVVASADAEAKVIHRSQMPV